MRSRGMENDSAVSEDLVRSTKLKKGIGRLDQVRIGAVVDQQGFHPMGRQQVANLEIVIEIRATKGEDRLLGITNVIDVLVFYFRLERGPLGGHLRSDARPLGLHRHELLVVPRAPPH